MLQIIGWLGCVYLLVKACELSAMQHEPEEKDYARAGAWIATISAFSFAIWLFVQGQNASSSFQGTSSGADYMGTNLDANLVDSDADNAIAAAERAMENAQRALDETMSR